MPRLTRSLTSPLTSLAALVAIVVATSPLAAQEQRPGAALAELVAIRAAGQLREGDEPAVDPRLERYRGLLGPLPYDRYAPQGTPAAKTVPQGSGQVWSEEELGVPYRAQVEYEPRGGKLLLTVEVTRRRHAPEEGHERVVSMKVLLSEGASYMIQCVGAFPDGDLLLVVRAAR